MTSAVCRKGKCQIKLSSKSFVLQPIGIVFNNFNQFRKVSIHFRFRHPKCVSPLLWRLFSSFISAGFLKCFQMSAFYRFFFVWLLSKSQIIVYLSPKYIRIVNRVGNQKKLVCVLATTMLLKMYVNLVRWSIVFLLSSMTFISFCFWFNFDLMFNFKLVAHCIVVGSPALKRAFV